MPFEFHGLGVLLLRNGEFLADGFDFILQLFVDLVQLIFLISDEAFLDFHLFNNFEVLIFQDENSVFEGHVFVDDFTIFLSDEGKLLTGEFEILEFAIHEFDSILFFLDDRVFFFHLREKEVILVVQALNLKIRKDVPFLFGVSVSANTTFRFRFRRKIPPQLDELLDCKSLPLFTRFPI